MYRNTKCQVKEETANPLMMLSKYSMKDLLNPNQSEKTNHFCLFCEFCRFLICCNFIRVIPDWLDRDREGGSSGGKAGWSKVDWF